MAASQRSLVQGLPSSQSIAGPGLQSPPAHVSPLVQVLPSLQPLVVLAKTQPLLALQLSVVQGLPSLQLSALPGLHVPPPQVSPTVHASPSLQARLLGTLAQPLLPQVSEVHGLLSSQGNGVPGMQLPPEQTSPVVQTLLSLQSALLLEKTQPVAVLQLSSVHGLPSLHVTLLPETQLPILQTSPLVHTLSSLHVAVLLVCVQPVVALQASLVQMLSSSQGTASPGTQPPPEQTSPLVHALLSLQASALAVNTQPPLALQLSVVHVLPSLQTTPTPEMQVPPPHLSPVVQELPSSQGSVLASCVQPLAAAQPSFVHMLSSLQSVAAPGKHAPPLQVSPKVQALLSLHGSLLLVKIQPPLASHVSVVHGLPSLQTTNLPGAQVPPLHTSLSVQLLPSLHGLLVVLYTQPVLTLQLSAVHTLPSSQSVASPGKQEPSAQVSPTVQALLSLHAALLLENEQPLTGSHKSLVHRLPSLQVSPLPLTQVPSLHTSPTVHTLPSLHAKLLLLWLQPPTTAHESVVHGFKSSQSTPCPEVQTPPTHTSPLVQALPSSHPALVAVNVQPLAMSQASVVQGLLSLHATAVLDPHTPSAQISPTVQAFPSSQALVLLVLKQPATALQLSMVQGLLSLQLLTSPGKHAPPWQVSPTVHPFASSQVAPAGKATTEHVPATHAAAAHTWVVCGQSESVTQTGATSTGATSTATSVVCASSDGASSAVPSPTTPSAICASSEFASPVAVASSAASARTVSVSASSATSVSSVTASTANSSPAPSTLTSASAAASVPKCASPPTGTSAAAVSPGASANTPSPRVTSASASPPFSVPLVPIALVSSPHA